MWRKQAERNSQPSGGEFAGIDKFARRRRQRRFVAGGGLIVALALVGGELLARYEPNSVSKSPLSALIERPTATPTQEGQLGNQVTTAATQAAPTATPRPSERLPPQSAATPAAVATATATSSPILPPPGGTVPGQPLVTPGDWPTYLNSNGSGYNPNETVITQANASQLKIHWKQQGASVISAAPTVASGYIYWGDWYGNEHATTLAGAQVWSVNLGRTWPNVLDPCGFGYYPNPGITSTATVANIAGHLRVFVGGGDGQLYALDAGTGKVLWHTRIGTYQQGFVWSSPTVYNGSVYTSLASFSDCPLVQGEILRVNASNGTIQNVFKTVPNGCTGGTVWGSPTVDPVEGAVLVAIGGQGACSTSEPYISSVMKLRASDLGLVSYWQVPVNQRGEDGDFGNTPMLFSYTSTSGTTTTTHLMVGIMQKNGTYYALDRDNLSHGPVWTASVSYNAGEGVFAPSAFDGSHIFITGEGTFVGSTWCPGTGGAIRALNPATGALIWGRCLSEGSTYGAVAASPGIVVIGAGSWTMVLSATTGATLYEYRDPAGGKFYAPAIISNGVIYQGNREGVLTAFGL